MTICHLGGSDFRLDLTAPPPVRHDLPPSPAQLEAVLAFYGPFAPLDLTDHQCHALLSVRNYARSCMEVVLAHATPERRSAFAVIAAERVLNSPSVTKDVVAWSERHFRRQPDNPQVTRTKHFGWLMKEVHQVARQYKL